MKFKDEAEAVRWVQHHIPQAVRAISKRAKTTFVEPFSSLNAYKVVTEELGKQAFIVLALLIISFLGKP